MRLSVILPLAAIAALTACNKGPTVTADNASGDEVAKKVVAAGGVDMISPGRWEGTMHITEMSMPGLPPEAQAKLVAARGDQKIVSCVTPEEAKADKASMFGGLSKDCKYDHFAMGGGKIAGVATCNNDGHQTRTTLAGTFSSDSYQMAVRSESSGKGPMENMTMAMSVDAKRVGECRGTPDET
jgi:hypothetical protein